VSTVAVLEVADIRIQPGRQAEFEAALAHGVASVIAGARGYLGHELRRGIESPERYLLLVRWATLEDHTVHFRGGPAFAQWRAIVGPFFAAPPQVEHFEAPPGAA
jgi:heme-degrading monooxygenase HmoA